MAGTKGLRIGARRFHALVQNLGDLVTIHDATGKILYATPSTAKLLGYPEEQLIGMNGFELIHPDDLDIAKGAFGTVLDASNRGIPTEYRIRRADGVWLDVESVGTNFLNDPAIRGIVLTSRVITERKQHERQLTAIATVASALRTASTRSEMLPVILDQVIHLLCVDGAAFAAPDSVSGDVVIELGQGGMRDLTGLRLKPGQGVSGYVLATGEIYRSENVLADPLFAAPEMIERAAGSAVAAACLPLKAGDETIGALWVEKAGIAGKDAIAISDEQLQVLTAIAEISANAIHRATLNEETQLHLHRLMVLQTIDLMISRGVDLQVTLNLLLGEISSRLHLDAADVLVMDPDRAMLKSVASRGFTTGFIGRSEARVGQSLAGRTWIGRRIVHVAGLTADDLPPEIAAVLAAEGFASYYGLPLIATGHLVGVLELFQRTALAPNAEWIDYLDGLAAHVASAVEKVSLIQDLQRSNAELMKAYDGVLEGWSRAVALRDHDSVEHTRRIADMTTELARLVGVRPEDQTHMWRGALLHDIGKIGMPDAVLFKKGPLSEEDWKVVRQHPVHAYDLMSSIDYLRPALDIPYCHHERWDGSGYPRGLKGSEIPLAARIFSVIDVYDALTSERPYRAAWLQAMAVEHLRQEAGRGFTPELIEVFIDNLPRLLGPGTPAEGEK